MRRMDRYRDNNDDLPKRYVKNQELYQDVANNPKYTNITDVTNSNTFEINNLNNEKGTYSSREEYQQMRKYHNVEPVPRLKKELAKKELEIEILKKKQYFEKIIYSQKSDK